VTKEDEDTQPSAGDTAVAGSSFPRLAKIALGVGAACCVGLVALAALDRRQVAAAPGPPTTVRSLLEGVEFAEITTQNLVAMSPGGASATNQDKAEVFARVARSLHAVHGALHTQVPQDHEKLGKLVVSPAQKDAAFRALKRYGDPRMVRLSKAVTLAAIETKRAGGNEDMLARRLTDLPGDIKVDIQQLNAELGQAASASPKPGLRRSNATEDLGTAMAVLAAAKMPKADATDMQAVTGRRLAAANDLDQDVCVHAHELLESMHEQIGDAMPEAPARVLLGLSDMSPSSTSSPTATKPKKPSFMVCLMKAAPSVPKASKCIADNFKAFMKMCMKAVR